MANFIATLKGVVARLRDAFFFLPRWLTRHHLGFAATPTVWCEVVLLLALAIWVVSALNGNPRPFGY